MAEGILDLILRIRKSGTGAQEANKELGDLKKTGLDTKQALAGLAAGAAALGAVYAATVAPTLELAEQTRDLSRNLGVNAKEASLLIQVADDLKVDYDTLTRASKELIKDGIQPNITNLGKLADEYNAIQDPVKKTQFAIDKFGKAGLEMTKVLEAGSAGLKELEAGAISAGLVMDEQAVQAARDYEIALDGLQDQLKGMAVTFGTAVIPTLTQAAGGFNNLIKVGQALSIVIREKTGVIDHDTAVMEAARLGGVDLEAQQYEMAASTKALWLEQQSLTTATGVATASQREQLTATDLLSAGMQRFSQELLFKKAAEELDADAALALGVALGVVDTKTLLATQAVEALSAKYDTNRDGAIDAREAAGGYSAAILALSENIRNIPDRDVNIRVNTTYLTPVFQPGAGGSGPIPLQHGGAFGPGRALLVGERGPELLIPQQNGFVMNNRDMRELIEAVRALGALGGSSVTVNAHGLGADAAGGIAREVSRVLAAQARGLAASRANFGS